MTGLLRGVLRVPKQGKKSAEAAVPPEEASQPKAVEVTLASVVAEEIGEDNGSKEQVKLRPAFKAKLQRVAIHAKMDMGLLIERYMTRFIAREDRRIAELLLREGQKESPPAGG